MVAVVSGVVAGVGDVVVVVAAVVRCRCWSC